MPKKLNLFLICLLLVIKVINSSTEYSVEDMITYMNQYLDTHASKSYYMTIDPDNLLDEIDHKLLDKYHIKYDHSLMHNDYTPYYVRVGDTWTKINYKAESAHEWMKPLVRGKETDVVEIPANWYLDDLPPMMFIKNSTTSYGFTNPRTIGQMWEDEFDWVYANMDYAVFPMTIHPDVSGRPRVLRMHEHLINHINQYNGVRWVTMEEMADDFLKRCPRKK